MGDPKDLVKELTTQIWKIVERGLKHERTAQNFESTEQELSPMFSEMTELAEKTEMPDQYTENLRSIMREMREARLKYTKVEWWYCCLAPFYQLKLEEADQSIREFILYRLPLQNSRNLLTIIYRQQRQSAAGTAANEPNHIRRPSDLEIHKIKEGLNRRLMAELKLKLTREGGDRVFNLTGLIGSGKTTLALQLCRDMRLRGWFNDNILFVSVGSKIESNRSLALQLHDALCENGSKAVLLVLDDVEHGSEELVEQWENQISSNPKSKIVVISRDALTGLGTHLQMTLLDEHDAITLLRYFVQPSGTTSFNFPDHDILLQVVRGCGNLPMAIKLVGTDLRGKAIVHWQRKLKEMSRQDHIQTNSEVFTRLQNSLHGSEDYESIKEFFMDLGLFPKNQKIPVTALIDMWVELYPEVEDDIDAMTRIHRLTAMNLADMVVRRRIGSDADNYYDNHFLIQHNILRELANNSSQEGGVFDRKRLIIEMNGNNIGRPQWWPQQPLQCFDARVSARILSISTDQEVTPYWCKIQASQAEVLVLNLTTKEYNFPKFIKKMGKLKVLIVINHGFPSTEFKNPELLGFLQTLTRIRLQSVSVPCLWHLKNLYKLSLYMCDVKTAFADSSFEFSKAMPKLEELSIEYCKDLVTLPAGLYDLITLKKLSISNCHKFTELPKEMRKLENLILLRISFCAEFKELPESITDLTSLSFLDISYCIKLDRLPDNIGALNNLRNLYMSGCPIKELPDSVMNMRNLRRVICDEYSCDLWEVFNISMKFALDIQTAMGMFIAFGSTTHH